MAMAKPFVPIAKPSVESYAAQQVKFDRASMGALRNRAPFKDWGLLAARY